ncbi:metalloproteinase [Pseudoalteromonas sp. NBT06-2]|uniref:imelysin family protein n=1 Tax=Pseudoalteromonas sp. NBT06-2 TaxID=2025950 RepID=UPI000BA63F3A|nr:imelysin family protein [Pseudoalteromonas sp. NBT06-2]PAJ75814.1 metalloproteinase [Pseudoalteromonas sp. NBT06-2]
MKFSKSFALSVVCAAILAGCGGDDGKNGIDGTNGADGADGTNGVSVLVTSADVITTNAQHAYAVYSDSLIAAKALKEQLEVFVAAPTDENFTKAKEAWLDAREPYGQSEVYRFREGPIDALTKNEEGSWTLVPDEGPEGRINAWPLAEALIDYTISMGGTELPEDATNLSLGGNLIASENENYAAINRELLTKVAQESDPETVQSAFAFGSDDRNVRSGYHAIEFLLWGQDLNGNGKYEAQRDYTAGHRKASDYFTDVGTCTSEGIVQTEERTCTRRGQYLLESAKLLVEDLNNVTDAWTPGQGFHYMAFTHADNTQSALNKILTGMGELSLGELSAERIQKSYDANSQEDEHSCFSDNTHRDIYLNAKGIQNTFLGEYTRFSGEALAGASLYDLLVVKGHAELANKLRAALEDTMAKASVIDTTAKLGSSFDIQIQENEFRPAIKATMDALAAQTNVIEEVMATLEVTNP